MLSESIMMYSVEVWVHAHMCGGGGREEKYTKPNVGFVRRY